MRGPQVPRAATIARQIYSNSVRLAARSIEAVLTVAKAAANTRKVTAVETVDAAPPTATARAATIAAQRSL